MPGMRSGVTTANPVLVAAFRSALMHQGLTALHVLAALAVAWTVLREARPSVAASDRAGGRAPGYPPAGTAAARREHPARRLARIGFGLLWILDGILQGQPGMAAGLPAKVIAPAAARSPGWVRHLVEWSGTAGSDHPIQASAAAVWIQVGIGIWMLAASRGTWSRLAGLAGLAWGLVVWVFGEAFGGILAPGLSLLFGAPGAAIFYCVAGALVALPERAWDGGVPGRWLLAGLGSLFGVLAVVQAWPGRGSWQGAAHGGPSSLAVMAGHMASTPQPAVLARIVGRFSVLAASHGFAINAVAVTALAGISVGLASQRRKLLLPVTVGAALFCLADWLLVQDLGFFGGLGTDTNSMLPLLLHIACGYLAVTRGASVLVPDDGGTLAARRPAAGPPEPGTGWRQRLRPVHPVVLASRFAAARATGVLALWAAGVVLLGAAPMAMAQASPDASPIIAQAIGGSGTRLDVPASPFLLTDQNGRSVSLAELRSKVVLLAFIDPAAATGPATAAELRAADQMLGAQASEVEIVAVAANPVYYTMPYLRAFDRRERLTTMRNWLYLTGSLGELRRVWRDYGVDVGAPPGGQLARHGSVFVIDRRGRILTELNTDPGAGTASSQSSFAVVFSQAAERALAG